MKIGILGSGKIASRMAITLRDMEEASAYAIASRNLEKAKCFAEEYGLSKAYGSYEELVNDPEVELVYIAVPHSHHFELSMLCINHGKPVLCEKAFTANATQARTLISYAEQKKVFLTEAIWTRYLPSRTLIQEVLDSGELGELKALQANLGYAISQKERIYKPELAGGALLDIGVYPLNFAAMFFGADLQKMDSVCQKLETGVDAQETLILSYRDGRTATLFSTIYAATEQSGILYGTDGYLVAHNINNISSIDLYNPNRSLKRSIPIPPQITGFEYEVRSCIHAIQNGALECPEMPHQETIRMMEWMDAFRSSWGIHFPFE